MTLELVHVIIDSVEPERVAAFWSDALGRPVDPGGNGFFVSIGEQQPTPGQVAWFFLRVPEPKLAKNRVHVDLRADDRRAEVARLESLGATVIADHDEWECAGRCCATWRATSSASLEPGRDETVTVSGEPLGLSARQRPIP